MKAIKPNRDRVLAGFAARLTINRAKAGLTQAAFAKSIGLSPRAYHSYEKGMRSMPSEALIEIAKNYPIDLHWLLTGLDRGTSEQYVAEVSEFSENLHRHLANEQVTLKPEKFEAIISSWRKTLETGKPASLTEVDIWISLIKD